jgi:dienelactone hydrolase
MGGRFQREERVTASIVRPRLAALHQSHMARTCHRRAAIITLVAGVAVTGCYTSHHRTPFSGVDKAHNTTSFEPAPAFRYEPQPVPFTNHLANKSARSNYILRELSFPSHGDNGQPEALIKASYYQSTVPGRHPMVIVSPIWGTYTYPPRKISSFIQNHSHGEVHVLHVHGERYLIDWQGLAAAENEEQFRQVWRHGIEHQRVTVIDFRRLVDWAQQRSEIDPDRIGFIGFSFGAVVGGTLVTQEPRFAAAVLVMGGAQQHKILAHCSGERTTAVRDKVAADFGWTADDLEAELEPIMRVMDASRYLGRADPSTIFLIDAGEDSCIIEESREALWQALGRPERMTMNYGHRKAFYSITPLGFNWMRYRIWDFFEDKLLD